ncbi:hypothetical protein [Nonlabens agnitus]|uniref:DUF1735 domain-containing protein n=1 Tax=Nonlabens agnitus TaxID=870484 RepID=A0A2S9WQG8_9FLAO|nr:hypothetical protein [Nonlabens agnitus]PRP65719.1 hypothetical protein BST86_00750 [Nonlabens agnitus]
MDNKTQVINLKQSMMKNLYNYTAILLACIMVSCEEEPVIFDNVGGAELVSFEDTFVQVPVNVGEGSGTASATVEVSTISNVDRTFNVSVVSEESTAPSSFYSVPTTVTIPANSYEGELIITGNEDAALTPAGSTVIVELADGSGDAITNKRTTFNVFLACPLDDQFLVGEYNLIVTASAGAFGAPIFRGPAGGTSTVVTLEVDSPTSRTYRAIPRGTNSANARTFTLTVGCDGINLLGNVADPVNPPLLYGPGQVDGTYDQSDDSEAIINFTGNVNSAFGGSASQGEFVLQKR